MKFFNFHRKISSKHWWLDLSINLIASLLAFSISLFITEQQKIKNKKETAWNVAQVTLSNIDELINNYDIVTTYYDDFLDQYEEIRAFDDLSLVPDSTCNEFIDYIEGWDIFAINRSPETTFSSTYELWDYLDIPLIHQIGNCYAYSNAFYELYKRDMGIIYNLSYAAGLDSCLDNHSKLKVIMNYKPFQNYMLRSSATSSAYHQILERLKNYNQQNKLDMNVSNSDLDKLVAPKHWASSEYEDFIFVVGPDM